MEAVGLSCSGGGLIDVPHVFVLQQIAGARYWRYRPF